MTTQEIKELIASKIAGQGNQVDVGNALQPILEAILDLIGGGAALPDGGTTGQVLAKKSAANQDVEWKTIEGDDAFVLDTANPCSYNDLQAAITAPKAVFIKHEGVFYPLIEKWENDEGTIRYINIASMQRQTKDKGATYFFLEALVADLDSPMVYSSTFVQPTGKPYTDSVVGRLTELNTENKDDLVAALNEVNGGLGTHLEVGVEKWYGTYTEADVTYQVYTKTIKIDALPATAGVTNYPHGITGIKQILSAYGFGTNGFVLNAPRQNVQDNIAIYQVSKGSATSEGTIAIEVGKDRSNMGAYIVLIYAKNN